jgi:hypothetical protein
MGRYMSFDNSKKETKGGMFISEVLKAKCGLRTHPKPIVESQTLQEFTTVCKTLYTKSLFMRLVSFGKKKFLRGLGFIPYA